MLLKRWKESFYVTSFAFLPIVIYWSLKEFYYPRPFWVFYDHIETLYYYTSLELTQGLMPHNIDNPGTLVQLVGTLLIYVVGDDPSRYQTFQLLAHLLILALSFLSTIILIRRTLGGVGFWLSTTAVWSFFVFPVALMFLQVWGPEPFYYIVGLVAVATLFWLFENREAITNSRIFFAGVPIGLLLSIKFTFIAWVAAYLITLAFSGLALGWKSVLGRPALGLLGISLGFVAITYPVWEGYPYMFKWLTNLSLREGAYGSGTQNLPSIGAALLNWKSFILGSKAWILLFVAAILFTAYKIIKERKIKPEAAEQSTFLTIFALSAVLFSMSLVARTYQQRYMLPIGLCGVIMTILCFKALKTENKQLLGIGMATLVFFVLVKSMLVDWNTHKLKTQQAIELNIKVQEKVEYWANEFSMESPVVIYGWRVPRPSFALRQNAHYEKYQKKIDEIYPREGHYTPWPMVLPQPSETQTFRLPQGVDRWDLAVIREEYIDQIPVSNVSIIDKIDRYLIIKSQSTAVDGL